MAIDEADFIRFLDQKLYEIASVMMVYYDCCHLDGSSCKAYEDNNLCCYNGIFGKGICPFWKNDQCQFANCDCKLWICKTAISTTNPKCVEGLKLLEQFGKLYGIVKPPLIDEPYSGADRQPR